MMMILEGERKRESTVTSISAGLETPVITSMACYLTKLTKLGRAVLADILTVADTRYHVQGLSSRHDIDIIIFQKTFYCVFQAIFYSQKRADLHVFYLDV